MKKIVRLTESDLTRIVKRVVNESGYQGIKNDLEYEEGIVFFANKLAVLITKFISLKRMYDSIIEGDSYKYQYNKFSKNFMEYATKIERDFRVLNKLITSYKERDMTLYKSDLLDYGFDLEELFERLENTYNLISELKSLTNDDKILNLLDTLENTTNQIVDLLYEIPD